MRYTFNTINKHVLQDVRSEGGGGTEKNMHNVFKQSFYQQLWTDDFRFHKCGGKVNTERRVLHLFRIFSLLNIYNHFF